MGPRAPSKTPSFPSQEKLRMVLREELALTFLMWTLSGSDLEKKRRVQYVQSDPKRISSMPVPSRAAVIT